METEIKTEELKEKVLDFPNRKSVELEEQTYRLEEMCDAMKQSLDNCSLVIEQQDELIKIVLASEKATNFRNFISDSEKQLERLKEQKSTLSVRQDMLKQVVDACKENKEIARIVTMLVIALGVFSN